jgi:hypothetical protein
MVCIKVWRQSRLLLFFLRKVIVVIIQDVDLAQQLMQIEYECNEMHRFAKRMTQHLKIARARAEVGLQIHEYPEDIEGSNDDNEPIE